MFDLINTGSWGLQTFLQVFVLWMVLAAITWASLTFYKNRTWFTTHSNLRIALLVAIPATLLILSGMMFLGDNISTPTKKSAQIRYITSPVMLVADTADTPSFECINTEQHQYSDSTRPKVIVQFDLQYRSGPESYRILKGIEGAIDEQALRCFRQIRLTQIGADQQSRRVNYAIPVEYEQLTQERTHFDNSENGPAFIETEKLPGKNLALQVNAHEKPGVISGKLLHGDPKKPLPNADIVLNGTQTWTVTDEEGEFYLDNLPSGLQQFDVNYLGHTIGHMQIRVN
ncbi:carboxypeptidase-like regulatory domain-containing protein [Halalkalibaculum sp. DA3122]|uniref:carboxypeptidase-like regulatory domain-containing protein n=1 Tax=Halalkalibaculum sp. DA3122 TaxID=3373607 RepID=UPI003754C23D